jgi:hypothetical protein
MTVSGWNLAVGSEVSTILGPATLESSPILFLMLLSAIACLAAGSLVFLHKLPDRLGAFIALVSVGIGLGALFVKVLGVQADLSGTDTRAMRIEPQIGFIGFVVAYIVVVVGAIMDLRTKP